MAWNPQFWTKLTGWSPSFHLPMLILSALLLIAAAIAYFYLRQVRFKDHSLHAKLAERASYITAGAGALGLLLVIFGYASTPLLGLPLLLILWLAILVGLAVFGAYYFLRLYPQRLADYELEEKKKKYLPKPKSRPVSKPAPVSAPKKKGAKKRRR
jgi:ABC-type transport system involved in multi-copper enzyme maturation permease subunit